MLENYKCYDKMKKETEKGAWSTSMGCSFQQHGYMGLKDKLKGMVKVENWFLDLNVFLGENVPRCSLQCLSWEPTV